jgi:hypothetical protein
MTDIIEVGDAFRRRVDLDPNLHGVAAGRRSDHAHGGVDVLLLMLHEILGMEKMLFHRIGVEPAFVLRRGYDVALARVVLGFGDEISHTFLVVVASGVRRSAAILIAQGCFVV